MSRPSGSKKADGSRMVVSKATLIMAAGKMLCAAIIACPIAASPGYAQGEVVLPPPTPLEASVQKYGVTQKTHIIEYKMLPMSDGARLYTVIIRPKNDNKHPVVMMRSPYALNGVFPTLGLLLEHDYAIVLQSERGSEWSEGEFHFLGNTKNDARDTLGWVAAQRWSNGRVGMTGCSSSAENQLLIGAEGHPALKALVPMSAGAGVGNIPGVNSQGLFYKNGVPAIGNWTLWYAPFGYHERPKLPHYDDESAMRRAMRNFTVSSPSFRNEDFKNALAKSVRMQPSRDVLRRLDVPLTDFEKFITVGPSSSAWDSVDLITDADKGATPSLNINGWADVGAFETVKLFEFQQNHPDQYLIMAPSEHCAMARKTEDAKIGDRPVGNGAFPYDDLQLAWFDRFLKDDASAWTSMPKVQVFLMGSNGWLKGDSWPLKETRISRLYLSSEQGANSLHGDGALSRGPAASSGRDNIIADPENPVPTLGGGFFGPISTNQTEVESREDVLVYSTPILKDGIAIAGDVNLVLHVSADVKNTDVAVKLVDVYPDGTAYNIADSILRLRYRDGVDRSELLEPGKIYEVRISGMVTGNFFAPGHRLRIEIAGSNFPYYELNMNTGKRNYDESKGLPANIAIHHGPSNFSYLEFTEYVGSLPDQR